MAAMVIKATVDKNISLHVLILDNSSMSIYMYMYTESGQNKCLLYAGSTFRKLFIGRLLTLVPKAATIHCK